MPPAEARSEKDIADILTSLGACYEAVQWSRAYGSDRRKAWRECPRGDWMLRIVGWACKSKPWSDGRKRLVACALDCADLVKHLRPEKLAAKICPAIAVLRLWIAGEASVKQAQKAERALAVAANAAFAADAWSAAASAAASAAIAAAAAARRVADSAVAAVARRAADSAAAADARRVAASYEMQSRCADVVRQHYPKPPAIK